MIRWADSQEKDQHLYFTSPSVTDDDRWLVILSERTGHPNIFAIDRTDGELRHLCIHGSSSREQDCHVHPVMTHDRLGVVFTSDRRGVADVYEWRAD